MTALDLPPGVGIDEHEILADIQGNILRGYSMRFVRHIVVQVTNATAARAFLKTVLDGGDDVPRLTTAEIWEGGIKPLLCLNVAITATGLRALGLREDWLQTFPDEFLAGAAGRADKVGDVGLSGPEHWRDGLGDPERVHLMWTIHAFASRDEIDRATTTMEAVWRRTGAFAVTTRIDGATLDTYTDNDGDRETVHFGYRDSISQPRFVINGERVGRADSQPIASVGAVLLGRVRSNTSGDVPAEHYRTSFPGVSWQMPEATDDGKTVELGVNGCYNAFRVLEQDVHAFEQFLETTADEINTELARRRDSWETAGSDIVWDKERVAAKLMGRWRNGVPLSPSHWTDGAPVEREFAGPGVPPPIDDTELNNFDYLDDDPAFDDPDGIHCPLGAHIRRANPRGSRIVQSSANYTRPLVRRGMPYGPPYDPGNPDDGHPRGLLGNFMCASLIAQYEAVMYDWINLGLQDPRVTGTNDPAIGNNTAATSRYEIPLPDAKPIVLTGFPRFTRTAGSIYLFCPSISALRFLAAREPATR